MGFTFQLQVAADSATPALRSVIYCTAPGRLAEALREPLLKLVRENYNEQPPNKMDAPSTGYWKSAADSTHAVTDDDSLTIATDKIGVRQHLYGGPIHPIRASFLSIPFCVETHGKRPRDFNDLVVFRLGRLQDAPLTFMPLALIKTSDAEFARNATDYAAVASKIMFRLVRGVNQQEDPRVIPTDDQFTAAIDQAFLGLFFKRKATTDH
jgi:hypothetical protein